MSEMKNTPNQDSQESEIAIKFGKGLAQPFTGKDGTQYMRIQIPNRDPQDKSPWQSFVVPAKAVHENHYGKGLWMKLPLMAVPLSAGMSVPGTMKVERASMKSRGAA